MIPSDAMSISSLISPSLPKTPPSSPKPSPGEATQSPRPQSTTSPIDEPAPTATNQNTITAAAQSYPIEENTNLNDGLVTAADDGDSSDTSTPNLPGSAAVNHKEKGKDPELYDLNNHIADHSSPAQNMNLETNVTNAHLTLDSAPRDIPTIEEDQYSHSDSEDDEGPQKVTFTVSCCHGNLVPASACEGNAVFELLSARERRVRLRALCSILGVGVSEERRCRICEPTRNVRHRERYEEGYKRLGYEGFEREDTIELTDDDDDDNAAVTADEHRKNAAFNFFVQTLLQADWTPVPPQQQQPLIIITASPTTPLRSSRAATVSVPASTTQEKAPEADTQRPNVDASQRPILISDYIDLTESISSSSSSLPPPPPQDQTPALRRSQRNIAAAKNPSPLKQVQNASSPVEQQQQPTASGSGSGSNSRQQQEAPLITGQRGEGKTTNHVLAYLDSSKVMLARRGRKGKGKGTILLFF